jgi:hypothetical protein
MQKMKQNEADMQKIRLPDQYKSSKRWKLRKWQKEGAIPK